MHIKSLHLIALIALAVAIAYGQSSSQPVYWSTTMPNCSSLGNEAPVTVQNGTTTLGYSCYVGGTFVWFAAGGIWSTAIRVAAPASGAVGVMYSFYDEIGNNRSLDTMVNNNPSSMASGNGVNFAVHASQPVEIELLGATSDAPDYKNTADGSVYVEFLCPDASTCLTALPQLLYSALPAYPWSLSVPIAWDSALSRQWSAVCVEDGTTNVVGLVIYNEDTVATTYTVDVYDYTGTLAGSTKTPSIPPLQTPGSYEGGVYSALLSDLFPSLPSGLYKILVDGGASLSAVEVLQISGPSATTLQVASDTAPGPASTAAKLPQPSVKRSHRASVPRQLAPGLRN